MTKFSQQVLLWTLLVLAIIYCFIEAGGEGDLYIYLCAAGKLSEGADIYTVKYINEQYQYYYSVLFAWVLQPFYSLPYYLVKLVWLLLNLGLYIHLLFLLAKAEVVKSLSPKKKNWFLFLSVLFAARFFHENIHASQISIIIFWTAVYGLKSVLDGNNLKGAFLLALGINLKLLPILFIPYLIYRGFWKAVLFLALALLVLYLLPSLLVGHAYNQQLLESWWEHINPAQDRHVLDVDERSFHGLSTLLATLLMKEVPDLYAMQIPRNIMNLSIQQLALVLLVLRLSLLSFGLFFVRSWPFRAAKNNLQYAAEISYLLLLIPLLFPHQQHYAFLFVCPAYCYILFVVISDWELLTVGKRNFLVTLLSIIYLICNLKLILGEFNQYYEHFKILTYAALLLIPLLAWASRFQRAQTKITESSI